MIVLYQHPKVLSPIVTYVIMFNRFEIKTKKVILKKKSIKTYIEKKASYKIRVICQANN